MRLFNTQSKINRCVRLFYYSNGLFLKPMLIMFRFTGQSNPDLLTDSNLVGIAEKLLEQYLVEKIGIKLAVFFNGEPNVLERLWFSLCLLFHRNVIVAEISLLGGDSAVGMKIAEISLENDNPQGFDTSGRGRDFIH